MPYIGRDTDKLSNVEVLDTITFDGSQSYTLQKNSVNFTPSSANTILISIDGVVQAGNFTVSGSTIDFGVAVASTSTNDFILHFGTGLITTPADDTVATAKLQANSVTSAKLNNDIISGATELATAPADTDEFLVSDAGTLKRIDYSLIKSTPGWVLVDTQTVSGTPSSVESGAVFSSTYDTYVIVIRRFNIDTNGGLLFYIGDSSSYTTSGYRWNISGVGDGGTSLINGEANANEISLLGETNSTYHVNTSQDCLSAVLWIHNPYNSNRTSIHGELAWENATDLKVHIANIGAHPGTDKSYDRWKIAPSSGNFEATTIIQTFGVTNA